MCYEKSRKPFSPLCRSCELVKACLFARKDRESRFHHCAGVAKLVKACLRGRKDRESSLLHCGGSVKPVPVCFSAKND